MTASTDQTKKNTSSAHQSEFAVIETGGKQYSVSVGDVIEIEQLSGEHKEGEKVTFDRVLVVDNGKDTTIGDPYIASAKVEGTLQSIGKGKKVDTSRFRAKSRYFKRSGHRQPYMAVKIEAIT